MFSYIVTKAIQVLHLHRHIIHLCTQNTQVYDTASSSVLGGCWHSNKETKHFEHSREMADWKWHYLLCGGALILEESYTQKNTYRSLQTHGKQSITLQVCCQPFTSGLLASTPINCLFFWYHYHRCLQRTERHLSSTLPTTMLLNYDYTLGQSSQATECIAEDGFQLKLQGLVF